MSEENKKLSKWQERRKRLIEPILVNADFQNDVAQYLEHKKRGSDIPLELLPSQIGKRYNFPSGSAVFLGNYVYFGVIDYGLLRPTISLISMKDKTIEPMPEFWTGQFEWFVDQFEQGKGVYLTLEQGTTRQEIERFIAENWSTVIAPKLTDSPLSGRPVRDVLYAERDEAIYQLFISGMTAQTIARSVEDDGINGNHYDLTPEHIRTIISRMKHKHDT
jgi:hypothetical protein